MIEVGAHLGKVTFSDHNGQLERLCGGGPKVVFCYPKASTPG